MLCFVLQAIQTLFSVGLIGENTWQVDPIWTTTTEGGSIASNYDEWLDRVVVRSPCTATGTATGPGVASSARERP